jgi:hypothetical protein
MPCKTCIQHISTFIQNATTPLMVQESFFNNPILGKTFY